MHQCVIKIVFLFDITADCDFAPVPGAFLMEKILVFNDIIVPTHECTTFTLERSSIMSVVRYTNKKTGAVTLYESTSHYDPVTKQSRPIRKYLGRLDPETGELIPSTKRKKKEATPAQASSTDPELKAALEKKTRECMDMERRIKELEYEIKKLRAAMSRISIVSRSILEISSASIEENET